MSSFKGKSKYMGKVIIADGLKWIDPSKKKYRPQHYKINKHMESFDNDYMWVVIETDNNDEIDTVFGINKTKWKYDDDTYNDEYKDGQEGN